MGPLEVRLGLGLPSQPFPLGSFPTPSLTSHSSSFPCLLRAQLECLREGDTRKNGM